MTAAVRDGECLVIWTVQCLCMSAKVPAVYKLAQQALKDGHCVVIGLQSTGEARTKEAVARDGMQCDFAAHATSGVAAGALTDI